MKAHVSDAQFDDLVAGFHRAAAGQIGWLDALLPLQRAMAAYAVYLHGVDLQTGRVAFSHVATETLPPECELDYIREFHQIDPRVQLVLAHPVRHWIHCWEHFDDDFVRTSRFYQDFLIPYGGRYVSAIKVLEGPSLSAVLGIHRGVGSAPLDGDEIEVGRRLVRHLADALALQPQRLKPRQEGRLGRELLDRLRAPVALLDDKRRLLQANPAARRLLDAGKSIVEREGCLHCVVQRDDAELRRALRRLLRDDGAASGQVAADKLFVRARTAEGANGAGLCLSALRPQQTLHAFGEQPLAMVVVHEPTSRIEHDPFVVAAAFGLSPAQARVAICAAEGAKADEIARKHFVAVSTVRTQLRSVFEKTGAAGQTQLVGLLAALPTAALRLGDD